MGKKFLLSLNTDLSMVKENLGLHSIIPVILWIWFTTSILSIALAEEVVITEQQAIGLFYQRNLDIIAAKYDLEQAKAEEIIAAAIPNPTLNLSSLEIADHYPDHATPAANVQIDQLIELGGKRRLRKESSRLGTQAAESDLQDTIRIFSNAVRHAFYELLLSQESVAIAQEAINSYQKILQASELRLKAGDIAKRDFTRIEVEALNAQSDLDKTLAHLTEARTKLAALLNWPEEAGRFAAENRWPEIKKFYYPLNDEEALINQAILQRPDIRAAQLRIDQANKDLKLAHSLRIPDITVSAGYAHDFGNIVVDSAMVGLSVPLPIFYQHKGEIDKAKVALNNTELQIRQVRQKIRGEIVSAVATWNATTTMVKRYQSGVLHRIAQVQDSAEFAYNHGSTDIIDLIEARRNYKAKMLEYYDTLANRSFAYADLLSALGEHVIDLNSTPSASTTPLEISKR
ncbi:outer membrane efflux protein [Candidatus Nitrosoglobus terrae]|uniref:Outer membrane efflux protein n=1 Tax=Candidatus Nitrosoglobus terrae TaxID=1630141 RepID=A0A1Q2SMZ5_9GAMM|nr:TolC family protein [Candidatus Nitrosoglobus terrae]BAW80477.1 outer membrane efflux protein [Candidatus Nitrosoglobus terrae]